jgi:hypothetical protein
MSGSCYSSGIQFNKGEIGLKKESFYNLKIVSAVLYKISLIENKTVNLLRGEITGFNTLCFPFVNIPNASHYALQLNTDDKRVIIIEFGQYLNANSEKKSTGIFGSFSKEKCRESENKNIYYYLLNDGARFYEIKKNEIEDKYSIFQIIEANFYNVSVEKIKKNLLERIGSAVNFHCFFLLVGNRITLGELVNHFIKEKNWNAKDYNVLTHNCQDFVAKCIKILKLKRFNEEDKKRLNEIAHASPCIIKAFYDVEGWSAGNTFNRIIQRIPFVNAFV